MVLKTQKIWWSLLKDIVGFSMPNEIPPLVHDDKILYSDIDKCEAFNNYFNSISSLNVEEEPELDFLTILLNHELELNHINVTEEDVRDQIKILNTKKAYGCDNVSPYVLKIDSENLTKIFNWSLILCSFPSDWKKAAVLPLFKKDSNYHVKNYRPV